MKLFSFRFFLFEFRIGFACMAFPPSRFPLPLELRLPISSFSELELHFLSHMGIGIGSIYCISCPRIWTYFYPLHQKACHNVRIGIGIEVDSTQHTVRIQNSCPIPIQIKSCQKIQIPNPKPRKYCTQ